MNLFFIVFSCAVDLFLLLDLFYHFFELKRDRKEVVVIFGIVFLLKIFVNSLQLSWFNLFSITLLHWLFLTFVFDAEFRSRLIYFIFATFVSFGMEFCLAVFFEFNGEVLYGKDNPNFFSLLWFWMATKVIHYILFLLFRRLSPENIREEKKMDSVFWIYLCVPLCTIGLMVVVAYSKVQFGENEGIKTLLTILFVLMLFSNVALFYAFQNYVGMSVERRHQQERIVRQRLELKRLSEIIVDAEQYNELVHNAKHHLQLIERLAREQDSQAICEVVEKINGSLNYKELTEYSLHKVLNMLLSEYAARAKKHCIDFHARVEPSAPIALIDDLDLVNMLGNLLDNAVEAASKKEGSSLQVDISVRKGGRWMVISVVNDYFEELKKSNGIFLTTKKGEGIHGIGIQSVSKTAKKYQGYLTHYTENRKFHAVLLLRIE